MLYVKYRNLNNNTFIFLLYFTSLSLTIIESSHQNSEVKLGKDYFYTILLRGIPTTDLK